MTRQMLIWVDGEEREFPAGTTVLRVAREIGFDRSGVTVALDGEALRRRDWRSTILRAGAWIDVLTATPGG